MLEPQTQALLEELAALPPAPRPWELTPDEMRAQADAFFAAHGLPPGDLVDREEIEIPGPAGPLRARVYRPRGATAADADAEPRGGLLYLHGGGMVANSIDTYDMLVQHLCARSECVIVACDYRLAPEHPFPAGVEDADAAARWAYDNVAALGIDPERFGVGGDSAGGYLTAVLTQIARDRGEPRYAFQLLIYPAVGTRGASRSLGENATGYLFERDELDWSYRVYAPEPRATLDPRVCPILQEDFSGLPPAFVLTAEYDPMRDDAEDYAYLMEAAGVAVELRRYEGTVHPFLNLAGRIDLGRQAIDECGDRLRAALGTSQSHTPHKES